MRAWRQHRVVHAGLVAATVATGCGRLGFDPHGGSDRDAAGADAVPLIGFSRITAGDQTTCGLRRDRAYCWGRGTRGEIGDGLGVDRAAPTEVALPDGVVTDVTVGEGHACAIVDATAYCWGDAAIGSATVPSVVATPVPVALSSVTAIAAGGGFACAIADGRAHCWGDDAAGRLGNGADGASVTPVAVTLRSTELALALDAGNDHACALFADDSVWCWGHNDSGALGTGATQPTIAEAPVRAALTGQVPALAGWHACAVLDGGARCWGRGDGGELGHGAAADSATPVTVDGMASGVTAIATGGGPMDLDASCAVVGGVTRCWGRGGFGRLGDGFADDRITPVDVVDLPAGVIVELALGYDHACGRRADGTVSCWGRGDLGQLGDGLATTSPRPVDVVVP